jgi:CubicO group peptidase (beta-lactamase class C family)
MNAPAPHTAASFSTQLKPPAAATPTRQTGKSTRARRRALMSLFLGATLVLSACGGGGDAQLDEIRNPQLLRENEVLGEKARTSVNEGLVGVVYASQHESAEKLYHASAGRTSLQGGGALLGDEPFQLASMSKAMTAALAAHLVQQGKLRWDSTPAELLPEVAATQDPAYAQVTLAQLLDHRSGLPAMQDVAVLSELLPLLAAEPGPLPQGDPGRRRLLARWMLSLAPEGRPGQDFVYSNAGYTVAGAMLEAAAGQDFEILLRQWARPLGMDPQWRTPARAPQGHEGAAPTQLMATQALPAEWQPWVDAIKPAGDVWLTPAGYGRWLAEHQRALQGKGHGLPPAYVQRLRNLKPGEYALGGQGSQIQGHGALVHSGADKGFMGLVLLRQDGKQAFFALSNTLGVSADGGSWVLDSLNRGLLHLATR